MVQFFLYAAYDRAWEAIRSPSIYRRASAYSSSIFGTHSRSSYTSELAGRKFARTTESAFARLETYLFLCFLCFFLLIFFSFRRLSVQISHITCTQKKPAVTKPLHYTVQTPSCDSTVPRLHDHLHAHTTRYKKDPKLKYYRNACTT